MFVSYETLSRNERRAAKKLAKQLLRTVPALTNPPEALDLYTAIGTAFWQPKNLVGVLIYGDDEGGWWEWSKQALPRSVPVDRSMTRFATLSWKSHRIKASH